MTLFDYCFSIAVACVLILTVLQIALLSAMRSQGIVRLKDAGLGGPTYFIFGRWLRPGSGYARTLATFELARDSTLSSSIRAISFAMSTLFIILAAAWVAGIGAAVWLAVRR
jgi:hypothetical protein